MIKLKSPQEIETMKKGGQRLNRVVKELIPAIVPSKTTKDIDDLALNLIEKYQGESSFKKVKGYKWSTCIAINQQIVHTPPSGRKLKEGDVVTLDIGMYYQGFHTDFATTIYLDKSKNTRIEHFLNIGKTTLYNAIKQARVGNRIGHISKSIEKEIYGSGYFIIKQLTGHGVGYSLHEDPTIPGFLDKPLNATQLIVPGLTIAIEVIYSTGTEEFILEKGSDWSLATADGSLAACFEHTIAVTDKGTLILT